MSNGERELGFTCTRAVRGICHDALTGCHAVDYIIFTSGISKALRHLGVFISLYREALHTVVRCECIYDSCLAAS